MTQNQIPQDPDADRWIAAGLREAGLQTSAPLMTSHATPRPWPGRLHLS
ncbi:hypothetical protein [Lysobacter niastensis]|uniref:Uncharacterized protein n=1 Tax=Lysobacter niastensis TaxID=380629 RepID=A0ABS0BD43_9GAMM|nr:hypothetical protein [Lysobacter niastensis]MBF6024929.1 hypothetical protein [Lysobacter niastensis]